MTPVVHQVQAKVKTSQTQSKANFFRIFWIHLNSTWNTFSLKTTQSALIFLLKIVQYVFNYLYAIPKKHLNKSEIAVKKSQFPAVEIRNVSW